MPNKLKTCVVAFVTSLLFLIGFSDRSAFQASNAPLTQPVAPQPAPPPPEKYIPAVRLLVLKHSRESMADMDANLAVDALNKAAAQGLPVKVVGNHYATSLADVQKLVNEYMTKDAKKHDTLVIHTIGHGFGNGSLQNLGQRSGVMKVLADSAEKHNQKVLWWQLSCFACASLPKIDTLPEAQQRLFCILSSSTAHQSSGTRTQARIMEKVFSAMAKKSNTLDANSDDIITANEFRAFLNTVDTYKRGDLFYAKNSEEPIFGYFGMVSHVDQFSKLVQPFLLNLSDPFAGYGRIQSLAYFLKR
jgi:hypothetical protein